MIILCVQMTTSLDDKFATIRLHIEIDDVACVTAQWLANQCDVTVAEAAR